jgi:uncharacterized membrane protein
MRLVTRVGCLAGSAVSSTNSVVTRSQVLASVVERVTGDGSRSSSLSASIVVHLGARELFAHSSGKVLGALVVLPAAVVDAAVVSHMPGVVCQLWMLLEQAFEQLDLLPSS